MKLFELYATLGLDTKGFETSANDAYAKADKIGKTIGTIIGEGINFALGFAKVANKAAEFAKDASDVTGHVDDMAQMLGISAKAYQEWAYVFGQSGLEIDRFAGAFTNLKKVMGGFGTKNQVEALNAIGLSVDDLAQLNVENAFQMVITQLQGMTNEAEKSAAAVALFGGSASGLPLLLNQGQEKINELKEEASALGLVIADTDISFGADMGDEIDKYTKSIEGMKTQIGVQFLPVFTEFLASVNQAAKTAMPAIQTAMEKLAPAVSAVIDGGLDLVTNLITWIAENGELAGTALALIGVGFYAVQLAVNPIGTIIYTIIGLSLALIANWEDIKETAVGIWNSITGAIDSAIEKLKTFLGLESESSNNVPSKGTKAYTLGVLSGDIPAESSNKSFASGIRYVPQDGYVAELHRGEAVLTRQQADDYRSRKPNSSDLSVLIGEIRTLGDRISGMQVALDGRTVGAITTAAASRGIAADTREQRRYG